MRFAALVLVLGAGTVLGACGGGHPASSGDVTFRAVITRVVGTSTVVQTVASRASTNAKPSPRQSQQTMADVVETGYRACLSIPKPLVRAARRNREARLRLGNMVIEMLASIGPRAQQPGLLVGCLRALKLPSLVPGTNT